MSKSEQTVTNRGAAASRSESTQKELDNKRRFIDDLIQAHLAKLLKKQELANLLRRLHRTGCHLRSQPPLMAGTIEISDPGKMRLARPPVKRMSSSPIKI